MSSEKSAVWLNFGNTKFGQKKDAIFLFFEKCTKSFTSFSQNQDYYTRVHKAAQISHHHSCPKKLISQSATKPKPKDYSSYGWCSSTKNHEIVENSGKKYIPRGTHSTKTNEGNPRSIYTNAISAFTIFEHLMHNCC